LTELVKRDQLEVYQSKHNTQPCVYYKNLYRYTSSFTAGSIALKDIDEYAENVKVTLSWGTIKGLLETSSDNCGDFKFDNLSPGGEDLTLLLEHPGYEKQTVTFELTDSINLGTFYLSKTGS